VAEHGNYAGKSAPADDAETSFRPTHPPGYELFEEIGRGGMDVVYRARDAAVDRDAAIKLRSQPIRVIRSRSLKRACA
jgi:serine/threonine protein kinase